MTPPLLEEAPTGFSINAEQLSTLVLQLPSLAALITISQTLRIVPTSLTNDGSEASPDPSPAALISYQACISKLFNTLNDHYSQAKPVLSQQQQSLLLAATLLHSGTARPLTLPGEVTWTWAVKANIGTASSPLPVDKWRHSSSCCSTAGNMCS